MRGMKSEKPVRARSQGSASHNGATTPGELQVTIWGRTDRKIGKRRRKVALVLEERDVAQLLMHLRAYGFDIQDGPQVKGSTA